MIKNQMSKESPYVQGLLSRRVDFQKEREELLETLKIEQEHLQTLNGAIAGIEQLLLLEGIKPDSAKPTSAAPESKSLADVLKIILSDRKPRGVEELVEMVQELGIDFEGKSPLRAVGFTLMGIGRGEKYTKLSDGRWKFNG
jgi:hypothetical protein